MNKNSCKLIWDCRKKTVPESLRVVLEGDVTKEEVGNTVDM